MRLFDWWRNMPSSVLPYPLADKEWTPEGTTKDDWETWLFEPKVDITAIEVWWVTQFQLETAHSPFIENRRAIHFRRDGSNWSSTLKVSNGGADWSPSVLPISLQRHFRRLDSKL
jgi:hypothetical protein